MEYILGIDIGTTNTKAVAYTFDGKVIAHANKSYTAFSPQEGYHELDPDILFESVVNVFSSAVDHAAGYRPAGVSFSSAMHGLIAVDSNCTPLTNMITWADLRSKAFAKELKHSSLGKKIYERTGTPIHPMSPLCKLMWMKANLPEIFHKAHRFISIKEYVFYKFFGEYVIDHSIASATGLFDIHDIQWNNEALAVAGITEDRLSKPVPSSFIFRGLKDEYAQVLKTDAQLPFIIGASDGCLAHLGSNAMHTGDVSLTIGTSGAVRMMTEQPVQDSKQRIFSYLLTDNTFISGGAINNGGNVLQWFLKGFLDKKVAAPGDVESFIDEAMQIAPGSEGLIFLPYIFGERAPVWDADAKGFFYGVSGIHTRAHFMRSILEGISFALLGIMNILEETIGPVKQIYAGGGFIQSEKWVQLLADVLNKKIAVLKGEDSSAAGAALLGLKALGITQQQSFFTAGKSFDPSGSNTETYMNNYQVYSDLYDKLKDIK